MRGDWGVGLIEVAINIIAGEGVGFRAVCKIVDVFRADNVDEFECGLGPTARLRLCLTLIRRLGLSGRCRDVELVSEAGGVLLADVEEVDAVVVSEAVDMPSVVVAVKAETMPVLNVPIMTRLITRTLATENAIVWVFILLMY